MVIEVNPQTRRQLLQNKLKLEWIICNIDDYVLISICFNCSRYNHRHTESEVKRPAPCALGNIN